MEIGDKVKIINVGGFYSSYKEWIMRHGKKYLNNWEYNNYDYDENDTYKIVAKAKHGTFNKMIYLIQSEKTKRVYMFEEKGIEIKKEGKLLKIINTYGVIPQLKYFQSEVFELNEAIISYENFTNVYKNTSDPDIYYANRDLKGHIVEEIADVMVMLEQFKLYYGISSEEIINIFWSKVDRQINRIENDSNNKNS